jgi:YidC/Oxa1 family membrane protein insertase
VLQAAKGHLGHGVLSSALATRFGDARLFGELPISATFLSPNGVTGVRGLAVVLVIAMAATSYSPSGS